MRRVEVRLARAHRTTSCKAFTGAAIGATKSGRLLASWNTGRWRNLERHVNCAVASSELGLGRPKFHAWWGIAFL